MAKKIGEIVERTKSIIIQRVGKSPQMDPAAFAEWMGARLQNRGAAFYGKLLTIILSTYFLSDLTSLILGKYIPEPPPARTSRFEAAPKRKNPQDYEVIYARNLFNSKGLIPGMDAPPSENGADPGGAPVKTTLPFNLVGTMILRDELRSIATIEDKSASAVYPVRVKDEIPQKARIIKIEARRVIFVNTSSNRREFVELPEELLAINPKITLGTGGSKTVSGGPGIERVSGTNFNISRSEVDKTLSDMNNVLTQARAVPHFENGQPAGYKLFQIIPGSIYDKLGLQNGDVIAGINGQTINDPGKAFEMLNTLRESPHVDLQIKRDGKAQMFSYEIR